jgi:predicted GIY-YIG superfamily endonuclease
MDTPQSYSIYACLMADTVVYYGSTSRDVEERYSEHLR